MSKNNEEWWKKSNSNMLDYLQLDVWIFVALSSHSHLWIAQNFVKFVSINKYYPSQFSKNWIFDFITHHCLELDMPIYSKWIKENLQLKYLYKFFFSIKLYKYI